MKKYLFFIVAVLLATVARAAVGDTFTSDGLTFKVTEMGTSKNPTGSVEVISYSSMDINPDLVVPSVVEFESKEYYVRAIGDKCFRYCKKLTSVTLPESLSKIGDYVFGECSNLSSVTCEYIDLLEIGTEAFFYCTSLASVTFAGEYWINEGVFLGCSNLTSIQTPYYTNFIPGNAFRESGLTSVVIPEGIEYIRDCAFANCGSLTSVTLPNTVTEICSGAFSECSSLESVELPNSLETISDNAFYKSGLKWLTIPESVTTIGANAFNLCNLYSVLFLTKQANIDPNAFGKETMDLTNIASVFKVAYYESLDLPRLIYKESSFTGFRSYATTKWTIEEDEIVDAEKGIIWAADKSACWTSAYYTGELILSEGMTGISPATLSYSNVSDVYLPSTLERVTPMSFKNVPLKEIVLPNRVSTVDAGAFDNISLIKAAHPDAIANPFGNFAKYAIVYETTNSKIVNNFIYSRRGDILYYVPLTISPEYEVSEEVTEIDGIAFAGCDVLTDITLPSNLSKLGESVWVGCDNIKNVICTNPTPAEAPENIFSNAVYDNATLYVPKGSKAAYIAKAPWSYFFNISEEEVTGVSDINSEEAAEINFNAPVEVYNLQGVRVADSTENLANGLYIIRQGNAVKKITVK